MDKTQSDDISPSDNAGVSIPLMSDYIPPHPRHQTEPASSTEKKVHRSGYLPPYLRPRRTPSSTPANETKRSGYLPPHLRKFPADIDLTEQPPASSARAPNRATDSCDAPTPGKTIVPQIENREDQLRPPTPSDNIGCLRENKSHEADKNQKIEIVSDAKTASQHSAVDPGGSTFSQSASETSHPEQEIVGQSQAYKLPRPFLQLTDPKQMSTTPSNLPLAVNHLHYVRLKKIKEILRNRDPLILNEIDLEIDVWERARVLRFELGLKDGESL